LQFIRRAIAAGAFYKNQRAIIHDEVRLEKLFSGAESVGKQTPQAAAAHFGTRAGKS